MKVSEPTMFSCNTSSSSDGDIDQDDWTTLCNQPVMIEDGNMSRTHLQAAFDSALDPQLTATLSENTPFGTSPNKARKNSMTLNFTPERARETIMRLSNEFAPIIEEGADTLIYIGVPPRSSGQSSDEYDRLKGHFERPYLMRSSTLRSLGSRQFDKFLGPMSARVERKLKKMNIHKYLMTSENIEYYIDLSPILNDDEALIQITELTVPQGALAWHRRAGDLGIPSSHVCGRDDLYISPIPIYDMLDRQALVKEEQTAAAEDPASPKSKKKHTKDAESSCTEEAARLEYSMPPEDEYTQLRHHTAIARLLHAIAGNSPKLNSAAKTWTFCMLAKYFDCAHNHDKISHWVISWLLESSNCHFIQNLPDVAYRIAIATQSQWLMRCTFAILVGQQAMVDNSSHLALDDAPCQRESHVGGALDDDEINRIDHAASALTQRVKNLFEELALFPGLWNADCGPNSELYKLNQLNIADRYGGALLDEVKKLLQNYLRRMIYMTLSHQYDLSNQKSIPPFKSFRGFHSYTDIPRRLRLLTQQFWHILRLENLPRDYSDTPTNQSIWANTQQSLREEGVIRGPDIPYASRKKLFEVFECLNKFLLTDNRSSTPEAASPKKKVKLSPVEKGKTKVQLTHEEPPTLADIIQHELRGGYQNELLSNHQHSGGSVNAYQPYTADNGTRQNLTEKQNIWPPLTLRQKPSASAYLDVSHSMGLGACKSQPRTVDLPIQQANTDIFYNKKEGFVAPPPAPQAHCELSSAQISLFQNLYGTAASSGPETGSLPMSTGQDLEDMQCNDQQIADQMVSSVESHSDSASGAKTYRTLLPAIKPITPEQGDANNVEGETRDEWRGLDHSTQQHRAQVQTPRQATFTSSEQSWYDWRRLDQGWDIHDPVPSPTSPEPSKPTTPAIFPHTLLQELQSYLYTRLETVIVPGYVIDHTCDFDIPTGEISTLLCLTDDEWKYLPLWAGGLDDGTGGVFNDGVEPPDAPDVGDGGFRGGAMGIIPGVGSSFGGSLDGAGSEFEEIMTEMGVSTVGRASCLATDGTATETVVSLDE